MDGIPLDLAKTIKQIYFSCRTLPLASCFPAFTVSITRSSALLLLLVPISLSDLFLHRIPSLPLPHFTSHLFLLFSSNPSLSQSLLPIPIASSPLVLLCFPLTLHSRQLLSARRPFPRKVNPLWSQLRWLLASAGHRKKQVFNGWCRLHAAGSGQRADPAQLI